MPATDYWYSIELQDGRVFSGHFALKGVIIPTV
jgi:gliding motility-associated-like protein